MKLSHKEQCVFTSNGFYHTKSKSDGIKPGHDKIKARYVMYFLIHPHSMFFTQYQSGHGPSESVMVISKLSLSPPQTAFNFMPKVFFIMPCIHIQTVGPLPLLPRFIASIKSFFLNHCDI